LKTVTVTYKVASILPQRIENLQLFCVAHYFFPFVGKREDYIILVVIL